MIRDPFLCMKGPKRIYITVACLYSIGLLTPLGETAKTNITFPDYHLLDMELLQLTPNLILRSVCAAWWLHVQSGARHLYLQLLSTSYCKEIIVSQNWDWRGTPSNKDLGIRILKIRPFYFLVFLVEILTPTLLQCHSVYNTVCYNTSDSHYSTERLYTQIC